MAERTNATVLKTVRPFTGSRGFKSHSLRRPLILLGLLGDLRLLKVVVDYFYGVGDGDA